MRETRAVLNLSKGELLMVNEDVISRDAAQRMSRDEIDELSRKEAVLLRQGCREYCVNGLGEICPGFSRVPDSDQLLASIDVLTTTVVGVDSILRRAACYPNEDTARKLRVQ
jgi:hypothetical protein